MEGKILAANYARENKIPYLGICLGMQIAVVEFARSVLGLEDANSTEFDPKTPNPCVIFMPEVRIHFVPKALISSFLDNCILCNSYLCLLVGFEDPYGRYNASRFKENILSG